MSETRITLLFIVVAVGVASQDFVEVSEGVMALEGGGLGEAGVLIPVIEIFVGDLISQPPRPIGINVCRVLLNGCDVQDLVKGAFTVPETL